MTSTSGREGGGSDEGDVERHPGTGRALALLRIYVGGVFLMAGWPKVTREGGFGGPLRGFVERVGLENGHAFYRPFLEGVVLPNVELFTVLVVAGEVLVALSLISGTATRVGASIAALMTANYMFTKGLWPWIPSSNDAPLMAIALVLAVTAAGRTWGVDGALRRRWPGVPLW